MSHTVAFHIDDDFKPRYGTLAFGMSGDEMKQLRCVRGFSAGQDIPLYQVWLGRFKTLESESLHCAAVKYNSL